jgi:antitoxin (DNA-binding transcriptional repressor) of toxin-antitoxin stability system
MTYTMQQASANLALLIKEAEEGKDVVIERGEKSAIRLVLVPQPVKTPRIPGQYAGQLHYSDDVFKPLETDEELREYGFDILADAKVLDSEVDADKPDDQVA